MLAVAAALRAGPCRPARSDSRCRARPSSVPRQPRRRATRRRSRRLSPAAARRRARGDSGRDAPCRPPTASTAFAEVAPADVLGAEPPAELV
jgi:hypothetical protein